MSLNWPIDLPGPAILGHESLVHKVRRVEDGLDDSFDSFYPQGSSQWDSLCHMEHPELGAYNGLGYMGDAASVDRIRSEDGIHVWATRGIAGRFVLADLAGYEAFKGQPIDCFHLRCSLCRAHQCRALGVGRFTAGRRRAPGPVRLDGMVREALREGASRPVGAKHVPRTGSPTF